MTSDQGGRAVKMLFCMSGCWVWLVRATSRSWRLPENTQSPVLGTEQPQQRHLEAIHPCCTWGSVSSFGKHPVQGRCWQTRTNSHGSGLEHIIHVERLNEVGEEAQAFSLPITPHEGSLQRRQGQIVFWRCTVEGQEAIVTNCSEGDPVQRQGKKYPQ